jgi:hypothetical protein
MMRSMTMARAAAVAGVLATSLPATMAAQQSTPQAPQKPIVPAKVEVVLTRYDGDKKTSSLPFSLYVNINESRGGSPQTLDYASRTSVRMGVDVPVGSVTSTSTQGVTTTKPDYRNVGTNIDCGGVTTDDGRFKLSLSITDSSIFTNDQTGRGVPRAADSSAFRQFSTSNTVTVKEGQTMQFAMATDKITGEVLKVDVTLTVLK